MTDDKTEEKVEKPARARKASPAAKAVYETPRQPDAAEQHAQSTPEADPAQPSAIEVNPAPAGDKVIEKGQDIEVRTDDNGIALETVWEERDLPGTDKKTRVLVAGKGTEVPAFMRAK